MDLLTNCEHGTNIFVSLTGLVVAGVVAYLSFRVMVKYNDDNDTDNDQCKQEAAWAVIVAAIAVGMAVRGLELPGKQGRGWLSVVAATAAMLLLGLTYWGQRNTDTNVSPKVVMGLSGGLGGLLAVFALVKTVACFSTRTTLPSRQAVFDAMPSYNFQT